MVNGFTAPLRWKVVEKEVRRLTDLGVMDLEYNNRLVLMFRERKNVESGLSFPEIAIILNPDLIYYDEKKEKWLPTNDSLAIAREHLRTFRKEMEYNGIVLYCIYDTDTRFIIYFNIPTIKLFEQVQTRIDRILKGIIRNKKNALKLLKMNRRDRNKLALIKANAIMRQEREKLKRKLSKERRKELDAIIAKFDKIRIENEKQNKKEDTKDIIDRIEREGYQQEREEQEQQEKEKKRKQREGKKSRTTKKREDDDHDEKKEENEEQNDSDNNNNNT